MLYYGRIRTVLGSILVLCIVCVSYGQVCNKTVIRTRLVFRPQTYTVMRKVGAEQIVQVMTKSASQVESSSRNISVCCPGYSLKRKKCIPVCEKMCLNSKCVAPNTCECLPGYKKFNEYRCLPHCDKCKFGLCSGPNICDCNKGYEPDGDGSCRPKCDIQCVNGYCSEPDTCSCKDGYELVEGSKNVCKPKCSAPCKNGYCSGPEKCSCDPGYHLSDDGHTCNPTCRNDCVNGDCVSPDVCVCENGYHLDDQGGSCVLIPATTLMTTTKRNCNSGYHLNEYTGECEPVPTKTMKTTESKIRGCQQGYQFSDELGKCVVVATTLKTPVPPKVTKISVGSRFQANDNEIPLNPTKLPESVEEYENNDVDHRSPLRDYYESNDISSDVAIAQPKADPPAYEHLINRIHESRKKAPPRPKGKKCDPPCIGGDCINGTCLCHEGNIHVEVNECASKCETSCQNGKCDEDGICRCSDGYELSNDNECIPICTMDCINGYCIEPDLCECFQNYILDETLEKSNRCIPLCNNDDEHGCVNGTCVAPNKCKCLPGFVLSETNKFHCIPMIYQIINSNYNQEIYPQLCTCLLQGLGDAERQGVNCSFHVGSSPGIVFPSGEIFNVDSRLGVYAFYLAVVLFIIFVVIAAHYYTMRKFQKKDYHVGYNEHRYGTVAYSIEKNNLFIA